jgi:heptosyltransferase-3
VKSRPAQVSEYRDLWHPNSRIPKKSMPLRRNILLFHLGALGDFVVTWPLALTLGRIFPQSRTFYVTHSQKGLLAERVLRTESVDVEAGWHHLFSDASALPPAAAKLLNGAHTIVSFLADNTGAWSANIRNLAPEARLVQLSTAIPADDDRHVTEFLVDQLTDWKVAQTAAQQILRSVAERGIAGDRPGAIAGSPSVVIHPGAGAARKCWPIERFIELSGLLAAKGKQVRFIVGEVEKEKWPADRLSALSSSATNVEPANMVELAEVIRSAQLFIGNDSGPGHLAGILGVPTVAIFGPGNTTRWRPLGPKVRVVSGDLETLAVEEVMNAVEGPAARG